MSHICADEANPTYRLGRVFFRKARAIEFVHRNLMWQWLRVIAVGQWASVRFAVCVPTLAQPCRHSSSQKHSRFDFSLVLPSAAKCVSLFRECQSITL